MSRTLLNFWLDLMLGVSFLAGLFVTAILRVVFPVATKSDDWSLWGLSYDRWFDLQFTMFCIVAATTLVHVMLHWNWVCGVIASRFSRTEEGKKKRIDTGVQTLYGVALLAGLLLVMGGGVFAGLLSVQKPEVRAYEFPTHQE